MASHISDQGKYIHLVFDGPIDDENIRTILDEASKLIRVEGKQIRLLSDFSKAVIVGTHVKDAIAEWTKGNKPYVLKSAVLGITGFKYVLGQFVLRVVGRKNIHLFDSEKEALDWLLSTSPE